MCPKYSFSLLLWLQSFPIYLGTLKPEVKLAIPRLPCSYLISQATELKPLGRKQKWKVGPFKEPSSHLFSFTSPGHFGPGGTLKKEAVLQSKEKEAGSLVALWSGRMNPERLISALLLCEKIYHPGWVPVTSRQMQFLIYTRGLPSRPAVTLQAWFPTLAGSTYASSSFSSSSCFSHRFFENLGTWKITPCLDYRNASILATFVIFVYDILMASIELRNSQVTVFSSISLTDCLAMVPFPKYQLSAKCSYFLFGK